MKYQHTYTAYLLLIFKIGVQMQSYLSSMSEISIITTFWLFKAVIGDREKTHYSQ